MTGAGPGRRLLTGTAWARCRPARSASAEALRLRLATGLLYGDTDEQREAALAAPDPLGLPWIAAALAGIEDILADLSP